MNAAGHWAAWLHRYGDDYSTDAERRAADRYFKANLASLTVTFSAGDDRGGTPYRRGFAAFGSEGCYSSP
jgi:hypothetical protein